MDKKIIGVTLVLLMVGTMFGALLGSVKAAPTSSTEVSGIISANTTWTLANSPYIVTGSVLVNAGVTLTIEPGVVVRFNSAKGLQIDGQLVARGSETQPIVFTSNQPSPAPGDWVNIFFTDTSVDAAYDENGNYVSGSIVQYCRVEYGGKSKTSVLKMVSASPFIDHSTISQNAATGIYNEYASIRITNNTISNNGAGPLAWPGGIEIYQGTANISGNTISNNADFGLHFSGSTVNVTQNIISNNERGGGIESQSSTVTIIKNIISDNSKFSATNGVSGGGIFIYGGSGLINDNFISRNWAVGAGGGLGILQASNVTVTGNTITRNMASGGGGLYVEGGMVTITYNQIAGNNVRQGEPGPTPIPWDKGGGISILGQPTINYNNIYGNTPYNVANGNPQGSATVDSTNNWWGTANATEVQARIYDWFNDASLGIIDYVPYLTNPVGFVLGDANGNGVFDALDITRVERIIAGLEPPPFYGADCNADGKINAVDITCIERKIAGLG